MKKFVLSFIFLFAFTFLLKEAIHANNIRITSQPRLVERDARGVGTVTIQFGLRWENSWRANRPKNYDAAWIFCKAWDGTMWRHVYLHSDSTQHHFGRGHGAANHQMITENCNIGIQTQFELYGNRMVIEPGFSPVQLVGVDEMEQRVNAAVGVFIYRRGNGRGTVELTSVNLFWNYKAQAFEVDDELAVKVFAIEMVYIPEGYFYLGGTSTAISSGYSGRGAGAVISLNQQEEWGSFTSREARNGFPFRVDSEGAIPMRNSADSTQLWVSTGATATEGTVPSHFPKGFRAFYIMKYELTQEGYADFLNALNFAQQDAHTGSRVNEAPGTLLNGALVGHNPWGNAANGLAVYRNHLVVTQIGEAYIFGTNANRQTTAPFSRTDERPRLDGRDGNETRNTDGQDIAMNMLSWYNLLAYAQFAGLRPMTEMEYEKVCRGPLWPVPGEFVWGNVFRQTFHTYWNTSWDTWAIRGEIQNFNTGDERFSTLFNSGAIHRLGGPNSIWGNFSAHRSVFRVGAFADSTTNRQASGATYWGVMNMADNVNEMVVIATRPEGWAFAGRHGDGMMRSDGSPHPDMGWPTATGSFYPKGFMANLQVIHGGINSDHANQHNAIAEALSKNAGGGLFGENNLGNAVRGNATTIGMEVYIDGGRISNRFGTARALYHWMSNNTWTNGSSGWRQDWYNAYDGGIRLVRTQHAHRPTSAGGSEPDEPDEPGDDEPDED
jgi:formylglycine-generating enzyme required for sulfatase activity